MKLPLQKLFAQYFPGHSLLESRDNITYISFQRRVFADTIISELKYDVGGQRMISVTNAANSNHERTIRAEFDLDVFEMPFARYLLLSSAYVRGYHIEISTLTISKITLSVKIGRRHKAVHNALAREASDVTRLGADTDFVFMQPDMLRPEFQ